MSIGWPDFSQEVYEYLGVDMLLVDATGILAPALGYNPQGQHGIGCLGISVSAHLGAVLTVTVSDAASLVPTWSRRATIPAGGGQITVFSPYPYAAASNLNVTVTSSPNQVLASTIKIFGLSQAPAGAQGAQLLRPDGRQYPVGALAASGTVAGGGTLVAAPGAGVHILVNHLSLFSIAAAGGPAGIGVAGTVNGLFVNLALTAGQASQAASANVPMPPGGILLDANTALTYAGTGALGQADVYAIYDLVA